MARESAPYMPFFGREFFADVNVLTMTLEQVGAYLQLIWTCWQDGSIPADVAALAAICKNTSVGKFEKRIWPALVKCFDAQPDGNRLTHHKVEQLREKKEALRTECSRAGKLGNQKRWGKDRVPDSDAIGTRSKSDRVGIASEYRIPNTDFRVPNSDSVSHWDEFKKLYPPHRLDEEKAYMAFNSRDDEAADILAGLRLWIASEDWTKEDGRFVKWASKFISEGFYKTPPKPADTYRDPYVKWEGR